jgi:uncharacterized protein
MVHRALLLVTLIAAAALAGTSLAQGPDPARVAVAKEMMEAAGAARQFDEAMPLIAIQMSQSFIRLAPDKGTEIAEVFKQLLPRFLAKRNILIEQIGGLYAAELTLDELNAIVAFYRSPVGMKFASVQPGIMRKSAALGQTWGQQIGIDLEAEVRSELKKRGIEL